MNHGLYRVLEPFDFRGHSPGTEFEARLDPGQERRALNRGAIELIRRVTPALQPGSYRLPPDWLPSSTPTTAPEGAFFMPKGGT